MTKEEMRAIAERANALGKTTWAAAPLGSGNGAAVKPHSLVLEDGAPVAFVLALTNGVGEVLEDRAVATAALIAAAPGDIAALHAEVARLYSILVAVHGEALEHAPPIAEYLVDELGERVSFDYWR